MIVIIWNHLQIFFDCSAAIAEIAGNRTDLSQFAQKLSLCQTFLVKIEQQHQKFIYFPTTRPPLFWGENPKCFALYLGIFQNFHYTSTWLERGLFRKVWRKNGWLLFVCSKTFAQNDDGMNSWTLLMYRQLETPAKFEQFIRRFTPKPFWLVSQEQLVLPLDIWSQ